MDIGRKVSTHKLLSYYIFVSILVVMDIGRKVNLIIHVDYRDGVSILVVMDIGRKAELMEKNIMILFGFQSLL